jgi:tRNA-Thr(GGU) m(6)t(6)A37 methyltransferase TsaA
MRGEYCMKICVNPIGFVMRDDQNVRDREAVAKIVLDKSLTGASDGLDDFSHLFIIFWMHKVSDEGRDQVYTHPWGRTDLPKVGVYATRTRNRRNPIGLTLVRLVKKQGNLLLVRGLDAFDGTPVLDIKPYDMWDRSLDASVPGWWHQK